MSFTEDGRSIVTGWSDGGVRFYTPESGFPVIKNMNTMHIIMDIGNGESPKLNDEMTMYMIILLMTIIINIFVTKMITWILAITNKTNKQIRHGYW